MIRMEENEEKQMAAQKKADLRLIQERDAEEKRRFKENEERGRQKDFQDNNVFSYIFQKKEHKAHNLGKRNE